MGVEPTRDTCMPHIGFEVRARHRPGLASVRDCSAGHPGMSDQGFNGVLSQLENNPLPVACRWPCYGSEITPSAKKVVPRLANLDLKPLVILLHRHRHGRTFEYRISQDW